MLMVNKQQYRLNVDLDIRACRLDIVYRVVRLLLVNQISNLFL